MCHCLDNDEHKDEFENIGNIGTFGDNLNENSLLNQYTPIEPFTNYDNRPEHINKTDAMRRYNYLNKEINENWKIIPNNYQKDLPLYSNYTYNNYILPRKNYHNMSIIQNTKLYHQKKQFPILGNDNKEMDNLEFKRYQSDLNFGDDKYLNTNINNQGDVPSLKKMYKGYLKEQNLRSKLMFKGVIQDMEILGEDKADYLKFYDKNSFESYRY